MAKRTKTPNQIDVVINGMLETIAYDPLDYQSYLSAVRIAAEIHDPELNWAAIENLRRHTGAWGRAKREVFGETVRAPRPIGRPRVFTEPHRTGSVRLSDSDWQRLREIGDGNSSEGLRRLLREQQQTVAGNELD